MAHVAPRSPDDIAELAPVLEGARAAMGFVPNSMLTMAHMPQLTMAFNLLAAVVFGADLKPMLEAFAARVPTQDDADQNLPPDLVQLIAFASSVAAGCRYCQAHTSHNLGRIGAADEKIAAILDYESHAAFTASERAALALAFAASRVPNETAQAHFEALGEHFTERQIVQIVAIIALFGFLNRWNDTMATQLEAPPAEFAAAALGHVDWILGKHGSSA
jgi:AhpD family alkylhydroperoxidase